MKLKKSLSVLLAIVMSMTMSINVMAADATATSEETRINYIDNGDFEEKTQETKWEGFFNRVTYHYFTSWTAVKSENDKDRVGEDDNAHGGDYALRVNSKEDTVYQMVEVPAGVTYELTGYVKLVENTGDARFGIVGYRQNEIADEYQTFSNTNIRFSNYAITEGLELENDTLVRGDWMKFTYTVETTQDTNYLYIFFEGLSGATYYDDISLHAKLSENLFSGNGQRFAVEPLSKYEISGNLQGDSVDAGVKWEGYREINSDDIISSGEMGLKETGYFSWIIETDADTEYLAVSFLEGSGSATFNDVAVRKIQEPKRLGLLLNSNSYYTTEETGIATVTPNTTAFADTSKWTGLCQVLQGENVLWNKDVDLSNGEKKITFSLTGYSGEDYVFKTTLYVDGIEMEVAEWEFDRCNERPAVLNDDGIFVEEDGDIFHPVFAYHMMAPAGSLATVDDCIDRLGVNLFQFDKGYVQEANWETAIAHLDYLESKGAKAIVCLYPGNKIASDPANKDLVSRFIERICDHDAIFAWGIEDEPVGKGTSEELLREAYEMVRELDPKQRPVYTIDQREDAYPQLIRNADVIAIDNYPYGRWDAMTYVYDSAKYAVETAATSNKPVYTLLQCFERYHGDYMDPDLLEDETRLYMPSANAIRNMIYQSLMAGTKGFGYYGLDYGPGTDEDGNNFDTSGNAHTSPNVRTDSELVQGIEEYAAKEQDLMFKYFVEHKYPTFNANIDGDNDMRYISFVKDGRVYMVILNKHEFAEQAVSVPLISDDGTVTITGFIAEAYAGMLDESGEPIATTDISDTDSTLDVTLAPGAAAVYIITPNETIDWGSLVTSVVSVNDEVYYGTLKDALKIAGANTVIKLLTDIDDAGTVQLNKGTLDLNGYTLLVDYFMAYDGTNVVDSSDSKTGLLKVAKDQFIFATETNNKQMPVYNGTDGYVFADIVKQEQRKSEASADTFELVFRPSFGTGTVVNNTLLANGGDAAGITIGIRLEWTADGEAKSQDLVYEDDMVKKVYSQGMAFYIKASGVNSFKDLTITPIVQSQLSEYIVWHGTEYNPNDSDINIGVWDGEINPDWD